MREEVVVVVAIDPGMDDWELHGVYGSVAEAERAIDYAVEKGDDRVFAKHVTPVLSFPEWVR